MVCNRPRLPQRVTSTEVKRSRRLTFRGDGIPAEAATFLDSGRFMASCRGKLAGTPPKSSQIARMSGIRLGKNVHPDCRLTTPYS